MKESDREAIKYVIWIYWLFKNIHNQNAEIPRKYSECYFNDDPALSNHVSSIFSLNCFYIIKFFR